MGKRGWGGREIFHVLDGYIWVRLFMTDKSQHVWRDRLFVDDVVTSLKLEKFFSK